MRADQALPRSTTANGVLYMILNSPATTILSGSCAVDHRHIPAETSGGSSGRTRVGPANDCHEWQAAHPPRSPVVAHVAVSLNGCTTGFT